MEKIESRTTHVCFPKTDLNLRMLYRLWPLVLGVFVLRERKTHMQTPWPVEKWGWGDQRIDIRTPLASTHLDEQADKRQC